MGPDNDEDRRLFEDFVGAVKPLKHDRITETGPRPKPEPRQRAREQQAVLAETLSHSQDLDEVETGDELVYMRGGLQRQLLRRLRRGELARQAELDLHGLTVPLAKQAVSEFIQASAAAGHRCVRVVHGKGNRSPNREPVLKSRIGRWLRLRNDVAAFCSAPPTDGGTGALYVLLRKI